MRALFGFIVRNGDAYLEANLNAIRLLGESNFEDHRIFFVENDSTDRTRDILGPRVDSGELVGQFMSMDGQSSIDLCSGTGRHNCVARVRRLAYLRNRLIDLMEHGAAAYDCDICIMLDMDFVHIDPAQFAVSVQYLVANPRVDGVFGMSYTPEGCAYDVGAVRPAAALLPIYLQWHQWVRVRSAFSGVGIYRWASLRRCRYDEQTNGIEHISLNASLRRLCVNSRFTPTFDGDARGWRANRRAACNAAIVASFATCAMVGVAMVATIWLRRALHSTGGPPGVTGTHPKPALHPASSRHWPHTPELQAPFRRAPPRHAIVQRVQLSAPSSSLQKRSCSTAGTGWLSSAYIISSPPAGVS